MHFLLALLLLASSVRAATLTDSVSSTLSLSSRPGVIEAMGQQNLHPRFGLFAGYTRDSIDDVTYAGWRFGVDVLAARWFGDAWIASVVLATGIGGMKGPVHDHSLAFGRVDTYWENRHLLLAGDLEKQRGNGMPGVDEAQLRAGYSPTVAEMAGIQPWLVLAWLNRSGTGDAQPMGILRLVTGAWWLELGTSLTRSDRTLGFAVSL